MFLFVRLLSLLIFNAVTLHTVSAVALPPLPHPINNRLLPHGLNPANPARFLQNLRHLNYPFPANYRILRVPLGLLEDQRALHQPTHGER